MIRRITKERPLKILGFTDMHLDDKPGCCRMTMKLLRETIEGEEPDLVVFVGDTVTGGENLARVQAFTALMTELGVPWAPAIGNHEGDNPASVTREEMMRLFRKSPPLPYAGRYCKAVGRRGSMGRSQLQRAAVQ